MLKKDSIFRKKYKVFDEKQGLYISNAVETFIQVKDNIEFVAPWGEVMKANKGDYLNVTNPSKVFAVKKEAFQKYYAECDKNGKFIDNSLNSNTQQENSVEL